ncbi:hypothetical protein K5V21_11795 [Clostridium sardiniense]|uniref:Co-chaperone DjlA N-terminal domain-containing protein n=1 Tax=Clostridium sardiniense TaxID=29369 RepID=A0ABS7KZ84_CLOSR|nr:hypothetical protein [Clostridium sardiniense]MBY0756126.1 hypothetical protein [Clostridium sardiniense]MDQ0458931.1 putative tellurite resistance protein B-like protein [Clostridium sardiniense]
MFLKELNNEEAVAFVNLLDQFANVDNEVAREEKRLIEGYVKELGLEKDKVGILSYDDIVAVLKKSKERIKRIIYFELIGLALVDGNYGDLEVDYLDKIAIDLDINRAQKIAFANFFYNFKEIHDFSVIETENKELKLLEEQAEALL